MVRHAAVVAILSCAVLSGAVPRARAQSAATPGDPVYGALVDELAAARAVGPPIRTVAFLGVEPATGLERVLQSWLLPRRPDLDRVATRLAAATATAFELLEVEVPEALASSALAVRAFDTNPATIAELNLGLDVDAVLVARVASSWDPSAAPPLEALLLSGRAPAIAFAAEATASLPEASLAWNPRALVWLVIPVLLLLAKPLRVAGTLVVKLELRSGRADENVIYTAYVARRALAQDPSEKNVIQSHGIPGDTVSFRGLPARQVFVSVRRIERDPKTLKISANHLEERPIALVRGRSASVSFQFKADLTTIEVRLVQGADGVPVTEQALLAVQGQGASSRYLRNGSASLHLAEGAHLLLVGYADRAFRVPLAIPPKTREIEVKIQVDALDQAFFAGCRDAVGPFVAGDFAAAADALEAAGCSEPAALLRAEICRARGDDAEAARLLEAAGRLEEAAELRAAAGDSAGTAELLERAGDFARAATHHERAGQLAAAARAFARVSQWEDALRCAAAAEDRVLVGELLEQKGDRLGAARVGIELGHTERATRLLQAMPVADARYSEACLLLAQLFCTGGEPELALQKLDEAGDAETDLELREQIARRLEEKGELRLALEACEHIRKRDIRYPGMAEKIEALRARVKEAAAAPAPAADGAATRVASRQENRRYDVEQEIGRGGMGVVYRARDRMLGRVVALKRLPDNLKEHPTAVKLFLREARSVAALNHPNIVTLFDAGQEDGAYYITMEYLEGHPLHVPIRKRGRFPVNDAIRLGVQVMTGLGYAHEAGIVHRDIKPSNLFLTKQGRVKIMDFGLAKMMEEVRKQASIIAGTPFYMAPEQGLGDVVDARADLYAFGVTLYEFLTGDVPFKDGDVTYHHRHTRPPDPRERTPEIPAGLAELVLALLAKSPDERPGNANAVRERLTQLLRKG